MSDNTIYSAFSAYVNSIPESTACFDEQRSLTYAQLDGMVSTIADKFPPLAHKRVGIVMNHSVEMIASILAVVKCGAAYIPVEPSFPDDRIRFVMTECQADFIITNSEYKDRFPYATTLIIDKGLQIQPALSPQPCSASPDSTAYILYTSGSTGLPKGVMVSNANVVNYCRAFAHEFHPKPGDIMLQHSVCSFDIFVEEVFTTLLNGATLSIPTARTKENINLLMEYVDNHGVTIMSSFPYLFQEMNKLPSIPKSLRLLISGGDVLRKSYIDRLLPKVEIYNTYGPSETTVCASYFRCNGSPAQPDGTYPIGKPVLGVDIMVCDKHGHALPAMTPGEICILGKGVSQGYAGERPVENRAFVKLKDGRRLYHSGDLGAWAPDGNLLFFHRIDSQVMILGRRVETVEVENILNQIPEIESGVVRSAIDDRGLAYLIAYFVPKALKKISLKKLKQSLRRFLPDYMVPEFFVRLNAIPLTPNGKVNSRALPRVSKSGNSTRSGR